MAGISKNDRSFRKRSCPKCGTPLPAFRVPQSLRELAHGGSTCPKCGARSDRKGQLLDADDET